MLPTVSPFIQFTDIDGSPMTGGSVYFGVENMNPETSPITVYWDAEGTQPASQPITTLNGYIVRSGTPAQIYCGSAYSMIAKNKTDRLVFYAKTSISFDGANSLKNLLAAPSGSSLIGYSPMAEAVRGTIGWRNLEGAVHVTDFPWNAACDGDPAATTEDATGTDDSAAVQAAIKWAEDRGKMVYIPGICRIHNAELVIRKPILMFGCGAGSGYSEDTLLQYQMRSGFLFTGTGTQRVRTRINHRASAADPQDAPLSVGLNVQNEWVQLRDFAVYLWFNRSDFSPTNYGSNYDVGIFNGCRVHFSMEHVHVLGYWRAACFWQDVTRLSGAAEFSDPDGVPFESGTVPNGADGLTLVKCFFYGGRWGMRIQGAKPKTGFSTYDGDYYDQNSAALILDRRGSFGSSDVTAVACSFYGTDHHSNYRRDDFSGSYVTSTAGGAAYIDGMAGNSSGAIQGMRFVSCRFATFEPFTIRLGRVNRTAFYGCHAESRSSALRKTTTGGSIAFDDTDKYGNLSMESTTQLVTLDTFSASLRTAFIDLAATYSNLNGAADSAGTSVSNYERFRKSIEVISPLLMANQPITWTSGDADIRAATNTSLLRLRGGTDSYATVGPTGLIFGTFVTSPLVQSQAGELDLRSATGSGVRMRAGSTTLALFDATNATITASGAIRPTGDNTTKFGDATHRAAEVFSANNAINTSDARTKQQRGALSDAELRAWSKVRPVVFQWIDSIARKGGDARLNVGYIAQDVQAAFASEGLDASRYALWCADELSEMRTEYRKARRTKTVSVTDQEQVVEVIEGRAVLVTRDVTVDKPVLVSTPLFSEDGTPVLNSEGEQVMHTYAETEEYDEPYEVEVKTGDVRYGLRYEQCLVFECAYLRSVLGI